MITLKVTSTGMLDWRYNSKQHNNNGPTIKWNTQKQWWVEGKLHRTDGPAIEWKDDVKEFWLHGIKYNKFEYWLEIANYD